MQNNGIAVKSYQNLTRKGGESRKTVDIPELFRFSELLPLAPENCNLNNFVWVFLHILSGVFRLSVKYGVLRFLLSSCCHADNNTANSK